MNYENREIPEGINVSQTHPLKDFVILVAGVFGGVIAVALLLFLLADKFSHHIPFAIEKRIASNFSGLWFSSDVEFEDKKSASHRLIQDYLEEKVQLIAEVQDIPEEIELSVHFVESETMNAFATIGGHIIVYSGLLKKLPHENAFMMVLAHEVAHIRHRDPIRAMSRGLSLSVVMGLFSGMTGSQTIEGAVSQTSFLASLSFNREQERDADDEALDTLEHIYGHTLGAEILFEVMNEEDGDFSIPGWLSTHPIHEERVEKIELRNQRFDSNVSLSPFPKAIEMALSTLE